VALGSSYSGADAGNYTITGQATTTASISQAALSISGITAADKTYNASDAATVNTAGATYNGLFAGDPYADLLGGGIPRDLMISPEEVGAAIADLAEQATVPLRVPIGRVAEQTLAARDAAPYDRPFTRR